MNINGPVFNNDNSRAYIPAIFGIALYKTVSILGNQATLRHRGIVKDITIAQKWLNGKDVEVIKIYDDK